MNKNNKEALNKRVSEMSEVSVMSGEVSSLLEFISRSTTMMDELLLNKKGLVLSAEEKNGFISLLNGIKEILKCSGKCSGKSSGKSSIVKERFPFPYRGSVNSLCHSLDKNKGLYTQCKNSKLEKDMYCLSCLEKMKKKGLPSP